MDFCPDGQLLVSTTIICLFPRLLVTLNRSAPDQRKDEQRLWMRRLRMALSTAGLRWQ